METPFLDQLVLNYCHCGECDECALHAGAKAELAALKEAAQQNAHLTPLTVRQNVVCPECETMFAVEVSKNAAQVA